MDDLLALTTAVYAKQLDFRRIVRLLANPRFSDLWEAAPIEQRTRWAELALDGSYTDLLAALPKDTAETASLRALRLAARGLGVKDWSTLPRSGLISEIIYAQEHGRKLESIDRGRMAASGTNGAYSGTFRETLQGYGDED